MTHTTYAITSITEIPPLVATFAAAVGFTASGTAEASVTHPTYAGAKTFTVSALVSGTGAARRERIQVSTNTTGGNNALAESPKLNPTGGNTAASVVLRQPTALHLFGNLEGDATDAGASFIAGVIEYGHNLYRHFYLGYVEKTTDYGGGEVTTGTSQCWTNISTGNYVWTDVNSLQITLPFSAFNRNDTTNGGLHVDHPEAAQPWYLFTLGRTSLLPDFDSNFSTSGNSVVLGGYRDSINSGLMAAGKSPFSGAQVLTPINLYIGKREGSSQFFRPVGAPAGVRMVHMGDLEPGAVVTLGSVSWRVFPIFSKSSEDTVRVPNVSTAAYAYPERNNSHLVGMAYRVGT